MEAFSLLKYWKGGGGPDPFLSASRAVPTTTILAATAGSSPSSSDVDNDDLFDLEFADDGVAEEEEEADDQNVEELGFPLSSSSASSSSSSSSSNDRATVSPEESDDPASEPDSRPPPPPVLLQKFRVFLVGLKKPKADAQPQQKQDDDDVTRSSSAGSGKLFAVKLKLEEAPFVSLFKSQGQSQTKTKKGVETAPGCEDNRRFSKEGVQRYLKKVKPLYVKVSRRMSTGAGEEAGRVVERQVSLPLRVVYKHLGKSRSGTSLAASSPVTEEDPAGALAGGGGVVSKRRDDSLLQQQDGIQGAILHCKRSFNASRDSDASPLPRSSIDPTSHEKLTELLSSKPSDCNGRGK